MSQILDQSPLFRDHSISGDGPFNIYSDQSSAQFGSELSRLRREKQMCQQELERAEDQVLSLRKKVVDLEQKNKLNQHTIEAMDEQRKIRDEMFEQQTKKLLDDEHHRLILELEEARSTKSNDIVEMRKTIDELKNTLSNEISAHKTTKQSLQDLTYRSEQLERSVRLTQADRVSVEDQLRRSKKEAQEAQQALNKLTEQVSRLESENRILKQVQNEGDQIIDQKDGSKNLWLERIRKLEYEIEQARKEGREAIEQSKLQRIERD
ncbi:MAG: hypothetical protein EZS28_042973, partial [Streblomastix strix]